MIEARYDRFGRELMVRGHAGYAERGQDIVCAGVSALVCTLMTYSRVDDIEGYTRLRPRDDIHEWDSAAAFAARGLQQIAGLYPDNLTYEETQ